MPLWQALSWYVGVPAAAVAAGLAAWALLAALGSALARHRGGAAADTLVRSLNGPTRLLLPAAALLAALPAARLPAGATPALSHVVGLVVIASVAWAIIALAEAADGMLLAHYRIDVRDNLHARQAQTRLLILRRILQAAVVVIAAAAMLMTFPAVQDIGASLLASAGLAGLVAGLAARPTLGNLIAGVQVALTQPIRIEDAVIVEGEWGWIEEITTTYVVVRIWDLRRMILPLTYFIEQPFQNWTRQTAKLLGSVHLYVDYSVPVEDVRRQLRNILDGAPGWDGDVCVLQVTHATDRCVELRALMSAPDAGTAWDLRCHVREKLIEFLQQNYPESLPRSRLELPGASGAGDESAPPAPTRSAPA